jgi:hypothetical protein
MLDPVGAHQLGAELPERAREVRLAEVPRSQILERGLQILGVLWEPRRELLDRVPHCLDVAARGVRIRVGEQSAVWGLEQCERVRLVAQPNPRRVVLGAVPVALGPDRPGPAFWLGRPVAEVQPQRAVIELAKAVIAEQIRVAEHDHPAGAVGGRDDQRRARGRRCPVCAREHDGAVAR